jgi:glycosyltransferase involved in cell wall biosynthesis
LEDIWANVIPEAMAFGKAVLCSKFAGAEELIHQGENGFIFDPFHTNALARWMIELIDSPGLIEKFGEKSLEIMKPYTIANAVTAFGEVIASVLKCPANKGHLLRADPP